MYFSRFSEYFSECWAFFRICEVFFRISGIFPDFQLVHKYFFDFSGVFFQLFFYLGLASIFPTFQSIFSTFSEYFSDFSEYFSDFMVFSQKKPEREIFGQAGREGWPPPPLPLPRFRSAKKKFKTSDYDCIYPETNFGTKNFLTPKNLPLDACRINRCV